MDSSLSKWNRNENIDYTTVHCTFICKFIHAKVLNGFSWGSKYREPKIIPYGNGYTRLLDQMAIKQSTKVSFSFFSVFTLLGSRPSRYNEINLFVLIVWIHSTSLTPKVPQKNFNVKRNKFQNPSLTKAHTVMDLNGFLKKVWGLCCISQSESIQR